MKAPCPACRVGSCPRSRFLPHTCTRPPCRASREVTALGSGHPTQAAVILGSSGEKAGGVGLHIRVSLSPHPTVLQDTPPGLCFGDPNSLFSSRMFVSSSFSWPVENLSAGGSGHPSCLPPTSSGAVTSALWCTVSRNIKPRSHSGGGTSLSRVTAWGSGVRAAHGRGRGQVGFTVSELTVHAQPASWVLGC